MNNRIKELWYQAVQPHTGDSWAEQTAFMEKFAELIVKECVSVVQQQYSGDLESGYHRGLFSATEIIKEHFGVE